MHVNSVLPQVWRASALAPAVGDTVASGHALLDAELPAGGWPLGALVELLAAGAQAPWLSLLLPALALHLKRQKRALVLLDPPFEPHVPALVAAGVSASQILWLRSKDKADALWLAEQAAGCADVAAVLAWLPQARLVHLRRLHALAGRRGQLLLFVFRDTERSAIEAPSCAPLRLALRLVRPPLHGDNLAALPCLRVDVLRRRGPPLPQPLWLPAHNPALRALLAGAAGLDAVAAPKRPVANVLAFPQKETVNAQGKPALDRLALAG